jgi:ABC-2 type transport system ATP-binding protein
MIEVEQLTKRYGDVAAVTDLSFTVHPGRVTGFLGPNGAGKSTTMRMVLGLDRPTAGRARVNGHAYARSPAPMREVGALLDAGALHKSRTARAHLRWLARAGSLPVPRVDEVLDQVGLTGVADRLIGEFSLGMRQRLGIAAALLGDPGVVILDEPLNGLDAEGIVWVRRLLQDLAAEGRTVFLSSHLMNEMEATADHVLVIGQGRLLADLTVEEMVSSGAAARVHVTSPRAAELADLVTADGGRVAPAEEGGLEVRGLDAARVGDLAAAHGIPLHQLTTTRPRLEEAFISLTHARGAHQGRPLEPAAAPADRPADHEGMPTR